LGSDDIEGIETAEDDEFDAVFGDGSDLMNIDQPTDHVLSVREEELLKSLNEKLAALKYESCDICCQEGFDLNVADGICSSCVADKGDPVKKWSRENFVHPAHEIPSCLKGLTDMEEMLIARVKTYMQVRYTKG
ncbi:hypothetical protein BDN71DRAFT_1348697, partial [Pleurotus eryngii]